VRVGAKAPRFFWVVLLVLLALALSCGRDAPKPPADLAPAAPAAAAFPVTVRDDLGRTVTVKTEPHRIVALLPSHTETLFALGVGDRVVGVDDFSDFPAEATHLPKLGALYEPRVEQILALAPDLVIASEGGPAPERLAEQGLVVWAGSARQLDEVYRVIEVVGRLVGKRDAAVALAARVRADIERVEADVRSGRRVRVYYELDPTPYTVAPGSFLGALLARVGGDNVIPKGTEDFPRIGPEVVIAGDPEVMIGLTAEDAARRPGWSHITAVRRGAVYKLTPAEENLVSRPGPRLGEGLAVLARYLRRGAGEGSR